MLARIKLFRITVAAVRVNDSDCGMAWTARYEEDITGGLKTGVNRVRLEVTNTWVNRLMEDHGLPEGLYVKYSASLPLGRKATFADFPARTGKDFADLVI